MKIAVYKSLRSKGFRRLAALEYSGLVQPLKSLAVLVLVLICLAMLAVKLQTSLEKWVATIVAVEKDRADENMAFFNQCMSGRGFLLADGNLLLTERALEVKFK